MKRFVMRRLVIALCASGVLGISTQAMASGFQLWEQDGASLGNYHAGYAAMAADASTAFYNPAGITRIKNQQAVLGAVAITADFKYRGSVIVTETPFPPLLFQGVTAQGGTFNLVPDFHYVAPINDCLGFGFSVAVPFGLKTDYGRSTPLRYAATLTSITVIDISPSLGFKVTDKASLGVGFDVQRAAAEFDSVGLLVFFPPGVSDTPSTNKADGTGYGYHLGGLYEFSPDSRVGLSYHSQVVHHLTGTSKFIGPIADALNNGPIVANRANTKITLPPWTALSGVQRINPRWTVMGSVIYTQWSTFRTLTLNNFAGAISPAPFVLEPSATIQINIPENYRNTWNVSIGADYCVNDQLFLRGGVGWDQTPVKEAFRNVQLPDQDRYVIALGGHYQANKALGFDLSWAHLFINQAHLNPPPQVMGGQSVQTPGNVKGGADVFGAQVTWNIC